MPKKKRGRKYTDIITFLVTADERKVLDKFLIKNDISTAIMMRTAMKNFMRDYKIKPTQDPSGTADGEI